MPAQIADMIEPGVLQIGIASGDVGEGGLRQDILGDIVDRAVRDFMNEADALYSPVSISEKRNKPISKL
jgi:hypothetical protein